jgi:iron only hydrogenase large subunit-like protein
MANLFSATMMLADLDFIAPSQACVLPVLQQQQQQQAEGADGAAVGVVAATGINIGGPLRRERSGGAASPIAAVLSDGSVALHNPVGATGAAGVVLDRADASEASVTQFSAASGRLGRLRGAAAADSIVPQSTCSREEAIAKRGGVPAQITLADCLACNGCVTTAETLLITSQSRPEVESLLASKGVPVIVVVQPEPPSSAALAAGMVSPAAAAPPPPGSLDGTLCVTLSDQTVAAASVELSVAPAVARRRLSAFCRAVLGAAYVTGLTWADGVAAHLTAAEFSTRLRRGLVEAPASLPHDDTPSTTPQVQHLPLIASACPGWVCYCEKTHAALLPLLAPHMGAQGIAGRHLKRTIAEAKASAVGSSSHAAMSAVVHVSVQPCFDRKLEAVRPENADAPVGGAAGGLGVAAPHAAPSADTSDEVARYTDCVLSTKELLDWYNDACANPEIIAAAEVQWTPTDEAGLDDDAVPVPPPGCSPVVPGCCGDAGSGAECCTAPPAVTLARGSGGLWLAAMHAAARDLGVAPLDEGRIEFTARRGNANHRVATHPDLVFPPKRPGGPPRPLLFALVYGFQHIQNVVRGLSGATGLGAGVGGVVARGRVAVRRPAAASANATGAGAVDVAPSEYHFIEMMACPEGCLNGGGQILAPVTDPATHRARLERIGGAFVAHAAAPCGAGERGDDL